jgi:anti-sigma factor RsiW
MRCSSCELLLDGYLEAALGRRRTHAVAAHLSRCQSCAALLAELRVVDGLLATTRSAKVATDFTSTVILAAHPTRPRVPWRLPLGAVLLLYVGAAWLAIAIAAARTHALAGMSAGFAAANVRDWAAIAGAARALAPATPVAAAAVTSILLLDLLLVAAFFYWYPRLRPMLALYLARGPRP